MCIRDRCRSPQRCTWQRMPRTAHQDSDAAVAAVLANQMNCAAAAQHFPKRVRIARRQLQDAAAAAAAEGEGVTAVDVAPAPAPKAPKFVPKRTPQQMQQIRLHSKEYKAQEIAALKAATAYYRKVRTTDAPNESARAVAKHFSLQYGVELKGQRVYDNSTADRAGKTPPPRGFKRKIPPGITVSFKPVSYTHLTLPTKRIV
eukprot:TRINITY_DN52034_c0_g2_i1.p1 TRINITY_DN52034_c0_g2~~TRINITY_DN52034_c0_g2_i1.p1  ORF type:complete len:202 (-),score=43.11 TRINITY_DN52034_c0_g2_i1:35-640(-)